MGPSHMCCYSVTHSCGRRCNWLQLQLLVCLLFCLFAGCWDERSMLLGLFLDATGRSPGDKIPFNRGSQWKVGKKFTWVIDYVAYHTVSSMNHHHHPLPTQISNGKFIEYKQNLWLINFTACGYEQFVQAVYLNGYCLVYLIYIQIF